jgi:hypothetical protein
MRTELEFTYDNCMLPTAAHCTRCGCAMRMSDSKMRNSAEIIMAISEQFLCHKRINHPAVAEDAELEEHR